MRPECDRSISVRIWIYQFRLEREVRRNLTSGFISCRLRKFEMILHADIHHVQISLHTIKYFPKCLFLCLEIHFGLILEVATNTILLVHAGTCKIKVWNLIKPICSQSLITWTNRGGSPFMFRVRAWSWVKQPFSLKPPILGTLNQTLKLEVLPSASAFKQLVRNLDATSCNCIS